MSAWTSESISWMSLSMNATFTSPKRIPRRVSAGWYRGSNRYTLARIVAEATGRYERLLVDEALRRSAPIVVVNPLQVRRFAGAIGQTRQNRSHRCRRHRPVCRPGATRGAADQPEHPQNQGYVSAPSPADRNGHHGEKTGPLIMPKNQHTDIRRHVLHLQKQIEKVDVLLDALIEIRNRVAGQTYRHAQHAGRRSRGRQYPAR